MCSQTSSLIQVHVLTFCGQNRIWQIFLYHSTDFISYLIVTKLHTCSHTSSLVGVRVSTFCGQKLGQHRIWHIRQIFLFLKRLLWNFTHVFTNIISCTSSRFYLLWSKTRSTSSLTDLADFFISYPIVTKLHTCVHKHCLLYELVFQPSAVRN